MSHTVIEEVRPGPDDLPTYEAAGLRTRVAGEAFAAEAAVNTFSRMFHTDRALQAGAQAQPGADRTLTAAGEPSIFKQVATPSLRYWRAAARAARYRMVISCRSRR